MADKLHNHIPALFYGAKIQLKEIEGSGYLTFGSTFYVHAGTGSDTANDGKSPEQPLATIDTAIGKCTANKGDVIFVMAGHAETITTAAGINADIAGISIVGLGIGESRPVVTFGTDVAASFDSGANDIYTTNIVFKNNIDSQTAMLNVTDKRFIMEDCELLEGSSKQALIYINVGAADNDSDGSKFRRVKIVAIAAGANSGIKLAQLQNQVLIEDCDIDGDFADAGIHNPTSEICTNLRLKNNSVRNRQTGDHAIELVSACTGRAENNSLYGDTPGLVFDPGSLFCSGNTETYKIDDPGYPSPIGLSTPTEYWIHTAKATADLTSGSAIPVFTVSGGRVLVKAMIGEVTTILSGTTETLKFQGNPTTGTTTDLCATLDVGGDEAGTLYSLPDAPGTALISAKSGGVRVNANPIVLPIGDVEAISSADLTGSIKLDIWWRPLDTTARLVAA